MLLFYDESKGASDKYPSSSVKISHTYLIWIYLLYSIHATQIEIFKNQISMSKILLLSAIYLLLSFMQFLVVFFKISVVIQESEKGHWHIPISEEQGSSQERTWLCVTRARSHVASQDSSIPLEGE